MSERLNENWEYRTFRVEQEAMTRFVESLPDDVIVALLVQDDED